MKSPLTSQRPISMQNITSDDSVNVTSGNVTSATLPPSPPSPSLAAATAVTEAQQRREHTNDLFQENAGEAVERSSYSQAIATKPSTTRNNKTSFFKKKEKLSKRSNDHGFISSFNQLTSNNLPLITSATRIKHVTIPRNIYAPNYCASISQHASKFEFGYTFDRRFDHFYRRNSGGEREGGEL